MNTHPRPPQTVQSVSRTLTLLKLLARNHEHGLDLPDLTQATGLNRSTIFRLLTCLVQTGYAQRDEESGQYRLHINAMQLGLTAMVRPPIVDRCRSLMQTVARATEDTVFLIVRNGDFAHCLHLEQGPYPVRVLTSLVGSFRLLGLGTGGQALLATLSGPELKELFRRHEGQYTRNGFDEARLRNMFRKTRRDGYATGTNLLVQGATAVAVPFEVTPGHYASLSVAAISTRLEGERRPRIAKMVKDALHDAGMEPCL